MYLRELARLTARRAVRARTTTTLGSLRNSSSSSALAQGPASAAAAPPFHNEIPSPRADHVGQDVQLEADRLIRNLLHFQTPT
jgi:hypothetical protein